MRLDPGEALRKTRGSVALAAGGGALTPWHSIDWERGSNTNWAGVSRSAPEASHADSERASSSYGAEEIAAPPCSGREACLEECLCRQSSRH
jgi:hypothetical protein